MTKKCSKCEEGKDVSCFDKSKSVKCGLYSVCKDCRRKYRVENSELLKIKNKEYYNKVKNTDEFKETTQNYYKRNRDKKISYAKKYFDDNKESVLKRQNEWVRNKIQTEPAFKLTQRIRRIIRRTLERKTSRSIHYFGVSDVNEFINILTEKCDNKNWLSDSYHLDHIWQVHWFDEALKEDPEGVSKIIHHHKNLRPITKFENFNRSKMDFTCLDVNDIELYAPYLNSDILVSIRTHFKSILLQ